MFSAYGPVLNVRIIMDRDTGQSKGYGFVTMAAPNMAQAAIAGLNGYKMGEKTLIVKMAGANRPGGPMPSPSGPLGAAPQYNGALPAPYGLPPPGAPPGVPAWGAPPMQPGVPPYGAPPGYGHPPGYGPPAYMPPSAGYPPAYGAPPPMPYGAPRPPPGAAPWGAYPPQQPGYAGATYHGAAGYAAAAPAAPAAAEQQPPPLPSTAPQEAAPPLPAEQNVQSEYERFMSEVQGK
jgi:splicing factor 1